MEGGGEWKRRCINSSEINRKAREACLENPRFPLRDPTRSLCFFRFVVRVPVCDGFKTNALCCREKKKACFRLAIGGVDKGEEASVKPPPGFLFSVLFFLFVDLCCAPRQKGQPLEGLEGVFMLNAAVWLLRLRCRPESQRDDRPDTIVFQIKHFEKLCQGTF